LIQTIGRCGAPRRGPRHLYAIRRTDSMTRPSAKRIAAVPNNSTTTAIRHHAQSIIKGVDMELAHIVEADYVTVALNESELEAAAASVRNEEQLANFSRNSKHKARTAKNFEFEKPPAPRRIAASNSRILPARFKESAHGRLTLVITDSSEDARDPPAISSQLDPSPSASSQVRAE